MTKEENAEDEAWRQVCGELWLAISDAQEEEHGALMAFIESLPPDSQLGTALIAVVKQVAEDMRQI